MSLEPIKSLSGSFGVFEDSEIETTGTEGAISAAVNEGVVTLTGCVALERVCLPDTVKMLGHNVFREMVR